MNRLNVELAKTIEQKKLWTGVPEIVPDKLTGGRYPINIPIAKFVADNLEFTYDDTDFIQTIIAYTLYLGYAKNPVGEVEFRAYLSNYNDIAVTKKKIKGSYRDIIRRCKFRTADTNPISPAKLDQDPS